jgi:ADP-ribosylglycohydrolase
MNRIDAAIGSLLGTAVGDSLGLPMEGLSRDRQRRMFPRIDGQMLLLGRGMCSDDTEHSCMVAQAVAMHGRSETAFAASMRWRLRWWLLALPAGTGFATLRAILKLWLFVPRRWQGVHSAGNGAAMRSALLGVLFADDAVRLRAFVKASTLLTHRDPKAECAALAVALAAREASQDRHVPADYVELLRSELSPFGQAGAELVMLVERAAASAGAAVSTEQFAASLGLAKGVSGYAYHTVPVSLHGWFAHPRDYAAAVRGVIRCGGDTDTAAAIAGGVVGAGVGRSGIPAPWLDRLVEWPSSVRWMERLAGDAVRRLDDLPIAPRMGRAALFILPRNLLFLGVVLAHGFRRLLPPY